MPTLCKCGRPQVEHWDKCSLHVTLSPDYIIIETCLWMVRGGEVKQLKPEIAPGRCSAESIHYGYEHLWDYYAYWSQILYERLPGEEEDRTQQPINDRGTHGAPRKGPVDPDDWLWE